MGSSWDAEDHLLARCRAGDLEAFGQIYARYEALVLRHAYHMLGHHEDASDVKQETFLKAYQSLPTFRGDCALSTWLLRICGNLCRDRLKSWQRRTEVLCDPHTAQSVLDGGGNHHPDPASVVEHAQITELVFGALRGLPPAQREILLLREIEEMSMDEIAVLLRCSRASVAVRLFRARQRLRERVTSLLAAKE